MDHLSKKISPIRYCHIGDFSQSPHPLPGMWLLLYLFVNIKSLSPIKVNPSSITPPPAGSKLCGGSSEEEKSAKIDDSEYLGGKCFSLKKMVEKRYDEGLTGTWDDKAG